MKEFDFIQWICRQESGSSAVEVGPGDDCAVLRLGQERLLVTVDQVLDGVHFLLDRHGPAAGGRKAVARNLSDIAAMAGKPLAMVASVAVPVGFSLEQAQEIYRGMREMGQRFDCPLVGGDVAAWNQATDRLQISVTVLGTPGGIEPVLRTGAKSGDWICVTGSLGAAWRGGRHLEFTPRLAEARILATKYRPSAMIDISDGLAADLGHIAVGSGVGAILDASAIPIHPEALALDAAAHAGLPASLAAALYDGEDYELLFTLPPERAGQLVKDQPLGVPVTCIGQVVAAPGLQLRIAGRCQVLTPRGWEHAT